MKNYLTEELLLSFKILQEEEAILILNFLSFPLYLDHDKAPAFIHAWCGSHSQQNNYKSSSSTGFCMCVLHETEGDL